LPSPRWFQPRFEGTLREGIPSGSFDGLASHLRRLGMRVTEEPEPPKSYRASAAPRRALLVEQTGAFVGTFDRVRVWQEDEETLRYEGAFTRWAVQLFVAWIGFSAAWAGVLVFACASAPVAWVLGGWLLLWPVPFLARHRRRACAWVERVAREEMRRAYVPRSRLAPAAPTDGDELQPR
jgi:hypothetical protein